MEQTKLNSNPNVNLNFNPNLNLNLIYLKQFKKLNSNPNSISKSIRQLILNVHPTIQRQKVPHIAWTWKEENVLAEAWLDMLEDLVIGDNQDGDIFYIKVW